jgi:uncharacterized RDD family membrane protein YckC
MLKLKRRPPNFRPLTVERLSELRDRPLASFGARATAFAIDFAVVVLICALVELLPRLDEVRQATFAHPVPVRLQLHGWVLAFLVLYFGLGTFLGRGQTPGKRLLRIRVVSLTHGHISLWHAMERALGYSASALELGFGFLQYFIHPNRQTVHDRIAETIVVKEPRKAKPDPDQRA